VKTLAALAFAFLILAMSAVYPLLKGQPARSPFLHLTFEPVVTPKIATTTELTEQLLNRHSLWNQIATREELCRRMGSGTVLAYFWYQPICMKDSLYEWIGLTWPRGFETIKQPPALLVWGSTGRKPVELLRGYEVHEGFALLTPDVGRAKARPTAGQVEGYIN
jgi:hypothetical protein